jgi:hypothetical protein
MYNIYSKNNTQLGSLEDHIVCIFKKILDLVWRAKNEHQHQKIDDCFQSINLASQLCVELGSVLSDNDKVITLDDNTSLTIREFWLRFFEDIIFTMGKIKFTFDDTIYKQLIETLTFVTEQWERLPPSEQSF